MVRYIANAFGCIAPKTKLSYTLSKLEHGLGFQIHEQSADITAFLAKNTYRASNGILVAADTFPEFQESGKGGSVTVYLRGSDKRQDNKLDVTRFVGNMQRDAKKAMVDAALAEFVDFVKSLKPVSVYDAPAYNDEYMVILL